ncbi:hypothetical protein [uncultured Microbulbifer sp.]|uniref:hypothetical protein n=1 Tax=uncultured Microbulbifer sp. TaxID=348147 RepID=UPI002624BDE8|nr:hypothetical protein [uncultured Microbulbifer sp.]
MSEQTIYKEIKQLSASEVLEIRQSGLKQVSKNRSFFKEMSYEEAIAQFVSVWSSRIAAILQSGRVIRLDLTGGLDSRVVLALLIYAVKIYGLESAFTDGSILFHSIKRKEEDYNCATQIAQKFGLKLNAGMKIQRIGIPAEQSVENWLDYNLGRYAPHILSLGNNQGRVVNFPGAGGEDHRDFYLKFGSTNFVSFLFGYQEHFSTTENFKAWMGDVISNTEKSAALPENRGIEMSIRHYRANRSRHHAAKMPRTEVMGVTLGSKYFYQLVLSADPSRVGNGQVLYDIMHVCCPDLVTMPYDTPKKMPTSDMLENLPNSIDIPALEPGQATPIQSELTLTASEQSLSGLKWAKSLLSKGKTHPNEVLFDRTRSILKELDFVSSKEKKMAEKLTANLDKWQSEKVTRNLHGSGAAIHWAHILKLSRTGSI